MIPQEVRESLKMAANELIMAQNELSRPQEDVVTLSACQTVRSSMKHMMVQYLLAGGADGNEMMSLDELMALCVNANNSFSTVNMSNIECKGFGHEHCDGMYCLSIENVSCCISAANDLKAIIWKELKVND